MIYDEISEACTNFHNELVILSKRLEEHLKSVDPIDYETASGLMFAAGALTDPIADIITSAAGHVLDSGPSSVANLTGQSLDSVVRARRNS